MFLTLFYVLVAILVGLYYFSKRKYDYWKKQNVPHIEPTPIVGNYLDFIFQRKHATDVLRDICKKFPKAPYIGTYFGTEPAILIRDPELLKLVTTKDFYFFSSREISEHVHREQFTQNLFHTYGDDWKVVRQNLTPVFTSAKMKNMFPLIVNCSHELQKALDKEVDSNASVDIRSLVIRFTMACIVSCGFGINSDTLGEGPEKNPFTKIGNGFFNSSRKLALKSVFRSIWPSLFYGLGLQVAPAGADKFFSDLMTNVFEARNYKPTSRNDFVDFILNFKQNDHITGDSITNLKTGDNKKVQLPVTEDLLISQCIVFFLAGFETSATTTSFTLYELAKHPEIQQKVQDEIDAYLQRHENKLTYDIVNELTYTWACVEETLRLYPILPFITREVVEDYTLPTGVLLEKGVRVHIPISDLHSDARYFPEPKVYRPERFLGDERRNIVPYTYMPFGEGGRICIGMRFAKMQVLAGLVTILKKYTGNVLDKVDEVEFDPNILIPIPKEALKLKFTPREGWQSRLFAK